MDTITFYLLFSVFLYIIISIFWPLLTGGAGYTPTPRGQIRLAMDIAGVGPHDVFYDLGCGTGSVLAEARRHGADVVGIEMEPLRWVACRLRVRGAKVILGNMFNVPLNDATAVFLFQYPHANSKLRAKLEKELKPGTRVVSYFWKFDGWEPKKVIGDLYLYTIDQS